MTSTETRSTLNGQTLQAAEKTTHLLTQNVHQATEKTAEVFKQNVHQATERAEGLFVQLPKVNLSEGVERYFEFVQKAVDLQRDMATQWADLLTSMSGSLREQAESFRHVVTEQTDKVTDLTVKQAQNAEQAVQEQADKVQDAAKDKAREAKRAEREEAKKAQEKAREAYVGLTKAELADQLAERGLPRTGTIEELIERLVTADSN